MKANIDKFQLMVLSPCVRELQTEVTIQVDDVCITSQSSAKLLGINIDSDLRFDKHVKSLCNKSNAKVQILKRIAQYLSVDCRLAIVRSFIISQFLYCSILFLFCRRFYSDRMDKIVYRALKVVFSDYSSSYEELLTRSNLKNLEIQRQKALLCEIYKSINDIGPTYMRDIFMI